MAEFFTSASAVQLSCFKLLASSVFKCLSAKCSIGLRTHLLVQSWAAHLSLSARLIDSNRKIDHCSCGVVNVVWYGTTSSQRMFSQAFNNPPCSSLCENSKRLLKRASCRLLFKLKVSDGFQSWHDLMLVGILCIFDSLVAEEPFLLLKEQLKVEFLTFSRAWSHDR